jgi:hypothetical protein
MPTVQAKVKRVEARSGEAQGRDAQSVSGSWLQPESYLIDVDRGGEVSKRTPEGWCVLNPEPGQPGGEAPSPGRIASDVAPKPNLGGSGPLVDVDFPALEPASPRSAPPPAKRRGSDAPSAKGRGSDAPPAKGHGSDASPAKPERRAPLVDLSALGPQGEADPDAGTFLTFKGIAALRTGAMVGSVASQQSAEDLDAALEALRSVTPVRVSRPRLVAARRRRQTFFALGALVLLGLVAAAALTFAVSKGMLSKRPAVSATR